MERTREWFEVAEPDVTERRQEITTDEAPGSEALAAAAGLEIEACAEAWAGRWQQAGAIAENAAKRVGEGGELTRGYRAILLYLAAAWIHSAGVARNDHALTARAQDMVRQSEDVARPAQWVKQMAPFGRDDQRQREPEDAAAINNIIAMLEAKGVAAYGQQLEEMVAGLSQICASEYEQSLVLLGQFLGAESFKPASQGRCDAVWCWANARWMALEAKSEQEPRKPIPHRDIRQISDQLQLLRNDRGVVEIPAGSAAILISPRQTLEPDAHGAAGSHVFLAQLEEMRSIAVAVSEAWICMPQPSASVDTATLRRSIGEHLRDHGVLPSVIVDKLTRKPIH